jgi:hypothetical protein
VWQLGIDLEAEVRRGSMKPDADLLAELEALDEDGEGVNGGGDVELTVAPGRLRSHTSTGIKANVGGDHGAGHGDGIGRGKSPARRRSSARAAAASAASAASAGRRTSAMDAVAASSGLVGATGFASLAAAASMTAAAGAAVAASSSAATAAMTEAAAVAASGAAGLVSSLEGWVGIDDAALDAPLYPAEACAYFFEALEANPEIKKLLSVRKFQLIDILETAQEQTGPRAKAKGVKGADGVGSVEITWGKITDRMVSFRVGAYWARKRGVGRGKAADQGARAMACS